MTAPESFDLNEALATAYMGWQHTYLKHMPQPASETTDQYTSRVCCIAYMEGAKAVQLLMQQALMDVLAEQGK